MEETIVISVLVTVILGFLAAFYFFVKAAYHFVLMLQNVKSKGHDVAINIAPFLFSFSPSNYTSEGEKHLGMFKKSLFYSVLACLIVFASFTVMEVIG